MTTPQAAHVAVLEDFASAYSPDSENGQALRAAIAAMKQQGWQPIETAPKDGTRILVDFGPRNGLGILAVKWEESVSGTEIWCVDDHKFGPYAVRGYVDEDIRGWQPLPAALEASR